MTGLLNRSRGRAREDAPSTNGQHPGLQPVSRTFTKIVRGVAVGALIVVAIMGLIGFVAIVKLGVGDKTTTRTTSAAQSFPDDRARAFAATFATALLTYNPASTDIRTTDLQAMVGPRIDVGQMLSPPAKATQQVTGTQPYVDPRARLDAHHARIVVAVTTMHNEVAGTDYWSIPVARDNDGGLAVYDYPAPTSPPAHANVGSPLEQNVEDANADAITETLIGFLGEYLAGGTVTSQYLVPGAQVQPLEHRYTHVSLTSTALAGSTRLTRTVLATVSAKDANTGADLTLRPRITVVYRDGHWFVLPPVN